MPTSLSLRVCGDIAAAKISELQETGNGAAESVESMTALDPERLSVGRPEPEILTMAICAFGQWSCAVMPTA